VIDTPAKIAAIGIAARIPFNLFNA